MDHQDEDDELQGTYTLMLINNLRFIQSSNLRVLRMKLLNNTKVYQLQAQGARRLGRIAAYRSALVSFVTKADWSADPSAPKQLT